MSARIRFRTLKLKTAALVLMAGLSGLSLQAAKFELTTASLAACISAKAAVDSSNFAT